MFFLCPVVSSSCHQAVDMPASTVAATTSKQQIPSIVPLPGSCEPSPAATAAAAAPALASQDSSDDGVSPRTCTPRVCPTAAVSPHPLPVVPCMWFSARDCCLPPPADRCEAFLRAGVLPCSLESFRLFCVFAASWQFLGQIFVRVGDDNVTIPINAATTVDDVSAILEDRKPLLEWEGHRVKGTGSGWLPPGCD